MVNKSLQDDKQPNFFMSIHDVVSLSSHIIRI